MYTRIWKPTCDKTPEPVSTITIYDGGAFWGELVGTEWRCWEVVSRHRDEESNIVETLIPMNADWVPYDIFDVQTYPVYKYSDTEVLIDGWKIEYTIIPSLQGPPPAPERLQTSGKASRPSTSASTGAGKKKGMKPPALEASGGQRRPVQNSRQYQGQPVKRSEQTWTPLAHIAHQETPRVNQLPRPSKQTPSSLPQSYHGHHSPSLPHPRQSSAHRRNPGDHRHNTQKSGVSHLQ